MSKLTPNLDSIIVIPSSSSLSTPNVLGSGNATINAGLNINRNVGGFSNTLVSGQLRQYLSSALRSTWMVKIFGLGMLLGFLISFKSELVESMSVIPGKLLPPNFYLWTLATHSFIEFHLINLLSNCAIMLLYSTMIEPLWGTRECLQFYFIVTTAVALLTGLCYYVAFAVTFNEKFIFSVYIHGIGGFLGGFTVAIKQIMPDTIILNASLVRIKQNHIPNIALYIAVILYMLNLIGFVFVLMLANGIFVSWVYLRFFQKHKNGTRGDASATFVFARFLEFAFTVGCLKFFLSFFFLF
jgi:membrane associated rhomboid family serine protease